MNRVFPLRTILIAAAVIFLCIAVLSVVQTCSSRRGDDARVGRVTGKALDRVAEQTPIIRQEQQDREDEVEQIPGADQRLPDGFGRDLERVRRGDRNPR